MDKHEIASILEEVALLSELEGENPFKIRAYRSAARTLENLEEDLGKLVAENRLTELSGIGEALAEKITSLYETGKLKLYEDLKKRVPSGLQEMLSIPGLGSKKIFILYHKLGIDTMKKLVKACKEGKVEKLSGFGAKTQSNILSGIEHLKEYSQRLLWWKAMGTAAPLLEELKKLKSVDKAEIGGSLRRKLETVHDIDFLASSSKPEEVMEWFTSHPSVELIIAKGPTKSSVRLDGGIQADLRVVPKESYPFALHYFTGSKAHNIKMRQRAQEHGFKLSEWDLTPLDPGAKARKKIGNEQELFKFLGLDYIPPELREDLGEFEAAENHTLPHLVTVEDICGAFHNHTTASDGHNTLEEMAHAAELLGWEYLGIADHSKSSFQANGLNEERALKQIDEIKKLNKSKKTKVHLFAGTECDILTDGTLDFADDILKEFDYVVVSIHSGFKQDEATTTKRLIKAIENPYTTMVGHLTGRLLLRREPYALNKEKVIDAAIANGKIIEINAHPYRLDMDWRLWHRASDKGLITSINPDAHRTEDLEYVAAGVNVARKGWLEKKHILNTHPLAKVKRLLKGISAGK